MNTPEVEFAGLTVPDREKRAVLDIPRRLDETWNARDATGFAELFTEDATFRVHSGEWIIGQKRIESFWRDVVFPSTSEGTRHEITPARVHFIGERVALGDGILVIANRSAQPPQIDLTAAGTLLMVKHEARWLILAARLASLAEPR